MNKKTFVQKVFPVSVIVFLNFIAAGCGVVQHSVDFHKDYAPKAETKIEVAKAANATGEKFDIDIEGMLTNALVEALRDEELLWTGPEKIKLTTACKILEYKKGDAFKRWLMPGWGATVLTIQCDLLDSNNVVGSVNATRTVSAGGGYTVGAWEKVFTHIARDVVADIQTRITGSTSR